MMLERRWLRTLRTRVVAGVLAVVLAALAVSGFTAVTAFHRYLLGQIDSELRSVLGSYSQLVSATPPNDQPGPAIVGNEVPSATAHDKAVPGGVTVIKQHSGNGSARGGGKNSIQVSIPAVIDTYFVEYYQASSTTGLEQIVRGNRDLIPRLPSGRATVTALAALAASGKPADVTSVNGKDELRLMAVRVDSKASNGLLYVTASLDGMNNAVGQLQEIVIAGMATVTLVVVIGVGFIVRRGLRPVETMAAFADRITAGDLASRVSTRDLDTEVGRLGLALNGMLTRIEAAVRAREESEETTRRFLADASHELRTPLTALRANADLYQHGALRRRSEVDEAMRRIAVEARRMGALVDDMLRLARLDQQPARHHTDVDLSALAAECAQRIRTACQDRAFITRIEPDVLVTGDEELLRSAIDNLLVNVAAHTPAGTTAVLSVRDDGTVEISDDGPGVPAGQLSRLFDRFYRGNGSSRRGSGLGLAIVAAVAADHGGTVTARPASPRGLTITLGLGAAGAVDGG